MGAKSYFLAIKIPSYIQSGTEQIEQDLVHTQILPLFVTSPLGFYWLFAWFFLDCFAGLRGFCLPSATETKAITTSMTRAHIVKSNLRKCVLYLH